ncbi:MAG: hypothetical protein JWL70_3186 [Acidimicrobiia bacterium]|nr:hypothetical protein [Acidimicrobiia bacterium]
MTVVLPSGYQDPELTTPARPADSIRRTSHIDIFFEPDGLRLAGGARDLRTIDGTATVVSTASTAVVIDKERRVAELVTNPADSRTESLVGLPAGGGFRAALEQALPDQRLAATPLYLLLDDVPVATIISGYAMLYNNELTDVSRAGETQNLKGDICSGWRSDGTMMVALRTSGQIPIPLGPSAPELMPSDDPMAWHDLPPLATGAMRRRRLVQVSAGDPLVVFAMFRDTHTDSHGEETVLHEYSLNATLDPTTLVLSDCIATPQVLPWVECTAAALSAPRLNGHTAAELRDLVRKEFRGTTTCTHLNDLLRSLGDLAVLAPAITGRR